MFCSLPLLNDLEVTGHPLVTLQISSEFPDLQFFAYLEDIECNGKINYVTEGMLKIVHRKILEHKRLYETSYPWHSFKKEDSANLETGKITEVTFDLMPISYLFKTSHSIRLSIATSDVDNFEMLPKNDIELKIFHNLDFASFIKLPVKSRPEF